MKTAIPLLIAIAFAGCATPVSQLPDPVATALLDKVVVENMDLDLGLPQEHKGELLWNAFANKPYESQFSKLSTKNWFAHCELFQARIISLAEAEGFDVESLRKALNGLNLRAADKTARIPVGAFAARKGTENVWIIVIKWEYARSYEDNGETQWSSLGHIEVVAISMKDCKKVDSVRCT